MKRALSTIVTALVAVSFAGAVWGADPAQPGGEGPAGTEPGMSTGGASDQGAATAKPTKKHKKKSRKARKKTRKARKPAGTGAKGMQPNYGKPDLGGPSGTMAPGGGEPGTGGGETGTGGGTEGAPR